MRVFNKLNVLTDKRNAVDQEVVRSFQKSDTDNVYFAEDQEFR